MKKNGRRFFGRLFKKIKSRQATGKAFEKQCDLNVSPRLDDNYKHLTEAFKNCYDVVFNRFRSGGNGTECLAVYIGSITNMREINDSIVGILRNEKIHLDSSEKLKNIMGKLPVKAANLLPVSKINESIQYILNGYCVIFFDGLRYAMAYGAVDYKMRKVDIPHTEQSIKGPQQGFIEDLETNVSLIRGIMKTPDLKMEIMKVGRLSATKIVIAYVAGVADWGIVNEVKKRIASIDIDVVTDSSIIEFLIEDSPYSPFPQVQETEKPNACCNELAQGRVVIMVDGSTFALIVPAVFFNFLSTADDNYNRFYFATFLRLLRYLVFAAALLAPSVYIALTTYHQEMIPTPLLVTIAQSRAETPLPAILEAFLMELVFEILREGSVRLPKVVGPAVTIVGGLVIGQGAVEAGIVSQTMVIVVSTTGLSAFALPSYSQEVSVRILRFPIMILAAVLGMFGIIMGVLMLGIHLASLRSFGVPYLSPFAPLSFQDLKGSLVKLPIWTNRERPTYMKHERRKKIRKGAKPEPDEKNI